MDSTTQTPSIEQQLALVQRIREDIAKRERQEATRAGCSAWHVMVRGSVSR